jgi:protein tyrosine kinase modulator
MGAANPAGGVAGVGTTAGLAAPAHFAAPPRAMTLADRWQILRRRRWPAFWAASATLIVAVATAVLWPPTYGSTGTILIQEQQLPPDLVQSTITTYADQRIQEIGERVMSTDNLFGIIQRFNLYPKLMANEPREVVIERMRKDISVKMISADVIDPRLGRATKADIAFSVSFDNRSPDVAARVANVLVSMYIDEDAKLLQEQSAGAAAFLQGQDADLRQRIAADERNLATFKEHHLNSLPSEQAVNTDMLIRAQDQVQDIDTQLRSLADQSTYLDGQLAQISPDASIYTSTGERVMSPADRLKMLRSEYARLSALYAPDYPDVQQVRREIQGLERVVGPVNSTNDLERQIDDTRSKLAAARQRYGPNYPDVQRLERQLAALTQALKSAMSAAPALPTPSQPDNPAYIELKAQRDAIANQLTSLQQQRAQLTARIATVEDRLAAAPAVQRGYDALMRQLQNDQIQYQEVSQKELDASLAKNLESEQKGERFTLIDPPLPPQIPESPNRKLLLSLGLLFALAAGFGAAFLTDRLDGSVRHRGDLLDLVQVPPLAVLPRILTEGEIASRRRWRIFTACGIVGTFALGLVLIQFFYRPLDVLWIVALRKLGIYT